jgi:glycosyltransferase involved in cell wall biosynthesis
VIDLGVAQHENMNDELTELEDPPAISVIMTTLNGERTIGQALASIDAQQGNLDFEVIVIDDGSTDKTVAIASGHRCRVISLGCNRGRIVALNRAFAEARAPIVAMLDDDCVAPSDWLQRLVVAWREMDASVTVFGGPVVPVAVDTLNRRFVAARRPIQVQETDLDSSATFLKRLRRVLVPPSIPDVPRAVFYTVGANMSVRREAFVAVGGFSTGLKVGGEEEDLCSKLSERYGTSTVWFEPTLVMGHDFHKELSDTLRRARAYGGGAGRKFINRGGVPSVPPRPFIAIGLSMLAGHKKHSRGFIAAVVLLSLLYREWITLARREHRIEPVIYPFVNMAEESMTVLGFLTELYRHQGRRQ